MSKNLMSLSGINMVYNPGKPNEVHALLDVSMKVSERDFTAIVGPSGSGKSTLMHIMGGMLRPTEGEYAFRTKEITLFNNKQLASFRNKNIGFVLQDFGLLGERSALENVCIPMLFSDIKWNKLEKLAMQVLKSLQIDHLYNRKINQLSRGQCQRVAIARALVMEPPLILADEPTGALDTETAKSLMTLFRELNEKGSTIIMVTHDQEMSGMCKKVIRINDGKIS
ncbi:MAG: ABC transporter ATP-binding protein [Clostridiales bacterium]|nr:ABC transporter ATP-binding protein [Clostridiales bacterium]